MIANKSIGRYLWTSAVLFVTYLFLSSFIVSKNLSDLIYLAILYATIFGIRLNK